jgi:hypothetical protein
MLITTEQAGLIRFSGHQRFVAICQFVGEEGNALLRQMENPQHNQFKVDHVEDPETKERARLALARVSRWIRGEIRKLAAPRVTTDPVRLNELDHLLPDIEPEEPFGADDTNGDGHELAFGGAPTVRLKPRRQLRPPVIPVFSADELDGEEEEEVADERHERQQPGTDPKPKPEPQEPRPPPKQAEVKRLEIRDVRIVSNPHHDDGYSVSFEALEDGTASLEFAEVGDSTQVARNDVRVVDADGQAVDEIHLNAGERIRLEIEADSPLDARAWLVTATEA